MNHKPYLIGIAGGSCSGKTLLANHLAAQLPGTQGVVLSLDAYYRDLSGLDPVERSRWNFDVPEALDHPLLLDHLRALVRGETVSRPEYDFATHTRTPRTQSIRARDWVILEGIFALHWDEVRALLDTKVFIRVDDRTSLARRTARDVRERGRTETSVLAQYTQTVLPMYRRHCEPTRRFADVVVSGEDPVEASARAVLAHIQNKRDR
jgi:uridine kinase